MQHAAGLPPPNRLLVSDADHDRLTGLARTFLDRAPDTAEELLSEMDRAIITTAAAMPPDVVRMGSIVAIRAADVYKRQCGNCRFCLPAR